jgi:hypothetical protein
MQDTRRGSEKLQQACCDIRNLCVEDARTVAGGAGLYAYFPKGIPSPGLLGEIGIGVVTDQMEIVHWN